MAQVIWSARSEGDLAEIYRFVRKDSAAAGLSLVMRIMTATRRLRDFPESGRIVPELKTLGIREVVVGQYRILYELKRGRVGIITVRHAARRLTGRDIKKS